jgi:AraC family transcriptional regulator of adaptative response / DNA-3-methyladenine glycosylase II
VSRCARVSAVERHDVELEYLPPLDGDGLLDFLGRRAVPGVEEVAGGVYRRSLRLPGGAGAVELSPADGSVRARFWLDDPGDLEAAVERCRALLDLDADPQAVREVLGADELLGPLVRAAPGRRVPGHVDGAELAVRAVLGQQVSLAGAATLARRLVEAYGERLERPVGTVTHLFPSAAAIAGASPDRLAMPAARQRAVTGLAGALARGEVVLAPGADREEARRRLLALPGIGPWTANYIGMRALRDPDAFLAADLGVRHALKRLGRDDRPAAAERVAERWRPYRAYAVQHLWASLADGAAAP